MGPHTSYLWWIIDSKTRTVSERAKTRGCLSLIGLLRSWRPFSVHQWSNVFSSLHITYTHSYTSSFTSLCEDTRTSIFTPVATTQQTRRARKSSTFFFSLSFLERSLERSCLGTDWLFHFQDQFYIILFLFVFSRSFLACSRAKTFRELK